MKRRLTISAAALATALLLFVSCSLTVRINGSGPVSSQSYPNLNSFSRIALSGTGVVKITAGSTASVVVQADENLLQYLSVTSSGGTLSLGTTPFSTIVSFSTLEYDITVPSLTGVSVSGAGQVSATGPIASDGTDISLSGVGSASIDLTSTGPVTVNISGSGSATLTGSAPSLSSGLSGIGSLSARGLSVKNANVSISGIGGAEVTVTNQLDYRLSGIGSLTYWGNPPTVSGYSAGIGSVHPGS